MGQSCGDESLNGEKWQDVGFEGCQTNERQIIWKSAGGSEVMCCMGSVTGQGKRGSVLDENVER